MYEEWDGVCLHIAHETARVPVNAELGLRVPLSGTSWVVFLPASTHYHDMEGGLLTYPCPPPHPHLQPSPLLPRPSHNMCRRVLCVRGCSQQGEQRGRPNGCTHQHRCASCRCRPHGCGSGGQGRGRTSCPCGHPCCRSHSCRCRICDCCTEACCRTVRPFPSAGCEAFRRRCRCWGCLSSRPCCRYVSAFCLLV
jgi:hypothetical protein